MVGDNSHLTLAGHKVKRKSSIVVKKTDHLNSIFREMVSKFYWKKETAGSVPIRKGYNVFVKKSVLKDLLDNFGPDAVCRSGWRTYVLKLVLHLMGGEENVVKIKTAQEGVGVALILREPTMIAVLAHTRDAYRIEQKVQLSWFI